MSGVAQRWAIERSVHVYVTLVCLLAAGALAWASRVAAWPPPQLMVALAILSVLIWAVGDSDVESRVSISLVGILLLASAVFVGPLGAGLLGLFVSGLSRVRQPWSARIFNMSLSALLGVVSGLIYTAAGGAADPERLRGLGLAATELAVPLLAADAVQVLVNVALIVGILRISQGVPIRLTASRLLVTSGGMALGYGVIAFLLVLLWLPAGLGPISVVLVFLPLLGAQWALGQYTAQRRAQEQHLHLLVAAIELRLPTLTGHAERVRDLSGTMAEQLGLGPTEVRDIERTGLLHDLGQLTLPPTVVASRSPCAAAMEMGQTMHGAMMIEDVAFLGGTAEILRWQGSGAPGSLGADIVSLASAYDLQTGVAGREISMEEFGRDWLAARPGATPVVDALVWALARRSGGV